MCCIPVCAIQVQDVGAEKDAITSLRAPTHYGRPNWDKVFSSLVDKHPDTDVGVVRTHARPQVPYFDPVCALLQFFCGPPVLSRQLHQMSNKYSNPNPGGTKFFFGKGTFSCRDPRARSLTLIKQRTFEDYVIA